jgi:hypothetical protein
LAKSSITAASPKKLVVNKSVAHAAHGAAGQGVVATLGEIGHRLRVAEKLIDGAGAEARIVGAGQGVVAAASGVDDRYPRIAKNQVVEFVRADEDLVFALLRVRKRSAGISKKR